VNWARFIGAVALSGFAISLSDWLFMGILFHDKYLEYPEIWRLSRQKNESKSVAISTLLGFVTALGFTVMCWQLNLYSYASTLRLALAIWFTAPLPLILAYGLWIKLNPAVVGSHLVGWLVRLCLAACSVSLLLG